MKHHYRIGEISRLYQISTDSLRYYEELGILTPQRATNGYRRYHIRDLWRLNVIRDLRELGSSMGTIKDYLDNRSLASTEALLHRELEMIQERIQDLETLRADICERLTTIQDAKEKQLDRIEEVRLAPRHCFRIHSPYQLDDEMEPLIKELLNKSGQRTWIIGNNRTGSIIPLENILAGRYQDYSDVFLLDKNGDDTLPGGLYLTICYQGLCAQNTQYIPKLLAYAFEHGLTPQGGALELIWSDIHQSDDENEFITELQLFCRRT